MVPLDPRDALLKVELDPCLQAIEEGVFQGSQKFLRETLTRSLVIVMEIIERCQFTDHASLQIWRADLHALELLVHVGQSVLILIWAQLERVLLRRCTFAVQIRVDTVFFRVTWVLLKI